MTKYICKYCNKEIKGTVIELGLHASLHTKRLELPNKALSYYKIIP